MKRDIVELEKILDYNFENKGLLRTALTHSSYAHEYNLKIDNERLELLGDAVIHLIITEFIMEKYPNENEGNLSALRSYCESESFLSDRAKELKLGDFIFLGKGENMGGGRDKVSLLSDTCEAVMAAVHIDGGFKKSKKLLLKHFEPYIVEAYDCKLFIDSKSELQKITQKIFNTLPVYKLISESGEEHNKIFTVEVSIKNIKSSGSGKTKKSAEKKAALKLLEIVSKKTIQ